MKQTTYVLNKRLHQILFWRQPSLQPTQQHGRNIWSPAKQGNAQITTWHVSGTACMLIYKAWVFMRCLEAYDGNLCVSKTALCYTDTSAVLISTPTKLCSSSVELKQPYNHYHSGCEALQQVWTQCWLAASWKLSSAELPHNNKEISYICTCNSCSFLVPKQPVFSLIQTSCSNHETPEPLFLFIPTSFNR